MKWIHKLIFALAICTISLIALYSVLGDTRKLVITPERFAYFATDDRAAGGITTTEMAIDGQTIDLSCNMQTASYPWPYCGISIFTDTLEATKGIDLSNYHTIRLKLSYDKTGESDGRLRFYLRNFNPAYSTADNEYTYKYNGMEFTPSASVETIEIPLANLQLMTWWLADNKIPIEHSAPEYSNVTRIELATGSGAANGEHHIRIERIEFEGAYLAQETLLFALLLSWVLLGLAFSLNELRKSKHNLAESRFRQEHLRKMNADLRAQNYEFAELAHRDALTGAMNRHAVRTWLEKKARTVRWGQEQLSALYLDLDKFKRVNDRYGHQMGDDILREFVLVVASSLEEGERLVRWGGEEFIVFLPETTLQQAVEKAEMIRKNVSNHLWVHGGMLTCSIGVAQMQEERVTEFLARADDALYQAKHRGRNRVEVNYGMQKTTSECG
ncbi:GGDEF domain-containing protein [Vibrio vulnificus]|uniref:GGDEF domain-containing protein n=1 Tax=Vibrio vulnificus TaxID=672 RepID=UPI003EDAE98C